MCMYVCVYIYIYTCKHMYMYTTVYAYVYVYVHVHMYRIGWRVRIGRTWNPKGLSEGLLEATHASKLLSTFSSFKQCVPMGMTDIIWVASDVNRLNAILSQPGKGKKCTSGRRLHFPVCACHPCAGAMLIFSASLRF